MDKQFALYALASISIFGVLLGLSVCWPSVWTIVILFLGSYFCLDHTLRRIIRFEGGRPFSALLRRSPSASSALLLYTLGIVIASAVAVIATNVIQQVVGLLANSRWIGLTGTAAVMVLIMEDMARFYSGERTNDPQRVARDSQ